MEVLWVSLFWLIIILCWKYYKDKIITKYELRIAYLENRLKRNHIFYETTDREE